MTVLVIGGTGTTGSRVAQRLDHPRIASRRTGFDWYRPETYEPALDGTTAVYLIPPVGEIDPAPHVQRFLDASGDRRVVLLSSSALPHDPNAQLVKQLPEWTVLRPSWFMQNFVGDHAVAQGIRQGEIVTATGDGRVAFVDADDIAAVAARALTGEPHNTEHVITGPRAISYAEAAAIITEHTGVEVRHRSISAAELAERLESHVPAQFAALLAALDEGIANGAEDRVTTTVEDVTGRPATSFEAFVAEHRDRW
ncbi:ergot alkaloid biosynthesis protein [Lentzea guizhouensis]|uniref:Ergot alkaloid biosynthesis protein n=1 Tax=Lentzea guizhouensis TaxID=1586287 RepID=A0A1B2HFV2_9PSEU|nr:ergot alkaloid biosynthesis protein [Lentzea guizhouensis]ANZ36592.1 ergot alkaloid biosynthesis protein [Lentzea guizhouensis]